MKPFICTVLLSLGLFLAQPLQAQVYQWVDENGKTRFSDKPPPGHEDNKTVDNTEVDNRPSSASGSQNRRTGRMLKAGTNPRPAILEVLKFQIADSELDEGIGTVFRLKEYDISLHQTAPADCRFREGDPLTVNLASKAMKSGRQQTALVFHRLLREQGYKVVDSSGSVFANQQGQSAELSIAALIKKANFKQCKGIRYNHSDSFNQVDMTIEWQVFDNLKREVLFEFTAEGIGDGFGRAASSNNLTWSFEAAVMDSAEQLLSQTGFRDALNYDSGGSRSDTFESTVAVNVDLSFGDSSGSFVDRSAEIERGTVTIRNPRGHGSGFFVSPDGYVVTNEHVVSGATRVMVITHDGQEYFADVVKVDKGRDVALLKAEVLIVEPLSVSKSAVRVGEPIYVLGTPLSESLSFSVTRGIVSGKRDMRGFPFYQTDAAVNPGNSGGPVVSESGDVIAISVSGIFTESGGSLNTNFLIPIEDALRRLDIQK